MLVLNPSLEIKHGKTANLSIFEKYHTSSSITNHSSECRGNHRWFLQKTRKRFYLKGALENSRFFVLLTVIIILALGS